MAGMQQEPPPSLTFSLAAAARILGYRDKATVRRLIESGQLAAFRVSTPTRRGAWRINASSVYALLAGSIAGLPQASPPEIKGL